MIGFEACDNCTADEVFAGEGRRRLTDVSQALELLCGQEQVAEGGDGTQAELDVLQVEFQQAALFQLDSVENVSDAIIKTHFMIQAAAAVDFGLI